MNIVLLADKKVRKGFEMAVRDNANINLIGVEMVIRGNTMSRIAEHHNPHILVVYKDVPTKDGIEVNDLISFLRIKRPNMRIIYVYGNITDNTAFSAYTDFLLENGITDIVTENDAKKVIEVIENPMTREDVTDFLNELFSEVTSKITDDKQEEFIPEQKFEELNIDFPSVTEIGQFNVDKLMYISSENSQVDLLKIGIAQLQHHNGCTHTAFEIASMLSQKNNVAVIIADNITFENLAVFHKISTLTAKTGLNMHGIDVYPYEQYHEIKDYYNVIVFDFSYLKDEQKKSFMDCDIKIMLSSAAEWDISTLTKFIYYGSDENCRNINFLFPRVTSSKFIKYNKQLIKSGITAYRLHNSPDWTKPDTENITVYRNILSRYTVTPKPKIKRRLFRIK